MVVTRKRKFPSHRRYRPGSKFYDLDLCNDSHIMYGVEVFMDIFVLSPFDNATEPCIITQYLAKSNVFRTVEIEGKGLPKEMLEVGKPFYMTTVPVNLADFFDQ